MTNGKKFHHIIQQPFLLTLKAHLPQPLPLMLLLAATHHLEEWQRVALQCFLCLNHYKQHIISQENEYNI